MIIRHLFAVTLIGGVVFILFALSALVLNPETGGATS
jgi:hypothetical protein